MNPDNMAKQVEQASNEQSVKTDVSSLQELSEKSLPSLDLIYEANQQVLRDLRQSSDAISTKATFVLGFATASLSSLIGLVNRVDPIMLLLVGIPYAAVVIDGYDAFKINDYEHGFPRPEVTLDKGYLEKDEKDTKLKFVELSFRAITNNSKINVQRAKYLTRSLKAFLFLIVSIAFVAIDAEVGVVSYLPDFLRATWTALVGR